MEVGTHNLVAVAPQGTQIPSLPHFVGVQATEDVNTVHSP